MAEIDLAVAALDDAPWIDTRPASGVVTASADRRRRRASRSACDRPDGGTRPVRTGARRRGRQPVGLVPLVDDHREPLRSRPCRSRRCSTSTPPLGPSDGLIGLHRSARAGRATSSPASDRSVPAIACGGSTGRDRPARANCRSTRRGPTSTPTSRSSSTPPTTSASAKGSTGSPRASTAPCEPPERSPSTTRRVASGCRCARSAPASTHAVPPGTGRAQLRRILDTLARVRPADSGRRASHPAARPASVSTADQITVMLSPLIAPEALDLVVSLGRQGMTVIVVDTLPDHVTQDDDEYTALAWRIRLLERRRELRLVHGRRDPRRAVARTREPRSGDPRHRAPGDRSTDGAAMSVRRLQQGIDRLWLVSWQRWVLIAIARARGRRRIDVGTGNGRGTADRRRPRARRGIGARRRGIPDSHTALAVEVLVVWQWLASTERSDVSVGDPVAAGVCSCSTR